MHELVPVLGAVIPVFLVMAGGWAMRRLEWLTEEADGSLLRITVNVLVPCLVLDSLLGNTALRQATHIFIPPLVGFGTVGLGLLLARATSRWIPEQHPRSRATFTFTVGLYNYGYVPLPLALALFDSETAGVLFVHNIGVEVALWTFGLILLGGARGRAAGRKLLSPPLLSIVGALVLNLLVDRSSVPGVLMRTVAWLGHCAIPMGLLLIGAVIADHSHEFISRQGGRVMTLACLLRLGVLPVLFLALAYGLPGPPELRRVIVLQAAMPSAVFPIIMAKHYGGDPVTAVRVVVVTTLVGLVTIPLWIRAGLYVLGP